MIETVNMCLNGLWTWRRKLVLFFPAQHLPTTSFAFDSVVIFFSDIGWHSRRETRLFVTVASLFTFCHPLFDVNAVFMFLLFFYCFFFFSL